MRLQSIIKKRNGEAAEKNRPDSLGDISSETEIEIRELRQRMLEYKTAAARESRAEETLRDSEERFRRIFEDSPLGMAISDPYYRFIRANDALCRMLGYTEKELTALTFKEITHPDHVAADAEAVGKLLHGEIPSYRTEKRYIRKDGTEVWGAVTLSAIRDKSGRFLHFLAMVEDISARRRDREALLQSERNSRELADLLPSCIFETDADGRLVFANRTALETFGLSEEDLRAGINFTALLAGTDRERGLDGFRRVAADGKPLSDQFTLKGNNGRAFPALVTARALMRNGQPAGVIGVATNITASGEVAGALRESEEKYRMLFESADEAIFLMEGNRFVDCNSNTLLMFGCTSKDDILGHPPTDFSPETQPDGRTSIEQARARITAALDGNPQRFTWKHRRKDGTLFDAEISLNKLVLSGPTYLLAIVRDVTEKRQADLLQNAVYQIARAADESASLDDLYKSVHKVIGTVMPAGNFYIALYDAATDTISFPYFVDEQDVAPKPKRPGKGLTEYVIRTGQPLLCDEATDQELRRRGEVEVVGAPSSVWLGVPLIVEKKTIGVMTVQHYSDPNAYGRRELRMLEFVSSEVAKSIEKKQAEKALKREWEKAQQYLAIAQVMLLVLDTEGRIVMINRKGCRILGYGDSELIGRNWIATCVRPKERDDVQRVFTEIMAGRAEQQEYHENHVVTKSGEERFIAWHNTIVKDETGKILGTLSSGEDITEHRQAERALAESEELYRKLIAAIPDMIIRTDLKGNILFANDVAVKSGGFAGTASLLGRNIFSFVAPEDADRAIASAKTMFAKRLGPQELQLILNGSPKSLFEINGGVLRDINSVPYGMVFLCRDISERKQTEIELHESVKKLRETLKASIDSLASAIEMRDPYTAGHQERVTRLACAIATQMGLEAERVEAIQVAGIIHDIGKLYVPAEILSKPTKLNELEYALIKMHAQVGFTILSKIDFPWPIAQIVHQHHEYINGSGYPRGLSGKDILLEAKILCVADVVEAMSSHRPYRPALGIQSALDEISQKRGILYDREVVDACLKLFSETGFKFD